MKISELISRLEAIKQEHGDIPVCLEGLDLEKKWITYETDVMLSDNKTVAPLVVDLWK